MLSALSSESKITSENSFLFPALHILITLEDIFFDIPSNLQFSAYAVGMALRKDGVHIETPVKDEKIVEQLCKIIQTGNLNEQVKFLILSTKIALHLHLGYLH